MKNPFYLSFKPLANLNPRQKQRAIYYSCLVGGSMLVFAVIWNLAFAGSDFGTTTGAKPTEKVLTGANRLNPQDAWHEQMNNQFEVQEKEIADLKKMIVSLNENLTKQGKSGAVSATNTQNSETKQSALPTYSTSTETNAQPNPALLDLTFGGNQTPNQTGNVNHALHGIPDASVQGEKKARFRSKGISKQQIALHNSIAGKNLETVDNTIPPGSFAQGILLSGVDASTATSASANPEPVLIELTDSGDLSRYFTSTVKGCRVTASCYGVLSKERVMMRLEKLSCVEVETGEVMVADVDGYVSGEDGKLGLRGSVVDRAGEHVRAAMVGGFLSSFGNFLAASSNPVTFSAQTGLAQITPMTGQDLLKQGTAKGASGALDKYTEFYIKRAEQLEPVIQVGAGRVVQVVFNKTVGIGKSALKQTLSTRNDKNRVQTLENVKMGENHGAD
jgi:hypothetical protein